MGFEKYLWIHAEPIKLTHGHAGITGPSPVSKALPNLKMQMIRRAEIGILQLGLVEEAGESCVFVDPLSGFNPDIFNVGVNGIKELSLREVMFDDDSFVGGCPENAENPAATDGIDGFVKSSLQIDAGMVVSWPVASPEFSINCDNTILQNGEAFPVRF
jgi:hypothetical protein